MPQDLLFQIRGNIAKLCSKMSFLPPRHGMWDLYAYIKEEQEKGNRDPNLKAAIESLDQYFRLGEKLLFAQRFKPTRDTLKELFPYCFDAANDPACPNVEEVVDVLLYSRKELLLSKDEETMLLYIVLVSYRNGLYPWRGRPIAMALWNLIRDFPSSYNVVNELAQWHKIVLDCASAAEVSLAGAKALLKIKKEEQAAKLAYSGLCLATYVPNFVFPKEKKLRKEFGSHADEVLAYQNHEGIKRDPIEASPEFRQAYDEVMEEAMLRYLATPEPRPIIRLWEEMKISFLKRGIEWNDPKTLNPDKRFGEE